MQTIIQGHGTSVTGPMKDYAIKKTSKIQEYFNNVQKVEITLDARNTDNLNRTQVAEVTVWAAGKKVIRASEAAKDMYSAIDLALAEIDRQMKKHKEKHVKETRRKAEKMKEEMRKAPAEEQRSSTKTEIIPTTRSIAKPMLPDEAMDEMKLLHQDFLLFFNPESKSVNLVYKNGKNYEVLNPEEPELKTISAVEAANEINVSGKSFIMFLNKDTNSVNVLYKRRSGNLGLIEPIL